MKLAGLLARLLLNTFPSANTNSGMKIQQVKDQGSMITLDYSQPYSYGDSAGITPDFPFNPGHRGPNSWQM